MPPPPPPSRVLSSVSVVCDIVLYCEGGGTVREVAVLAVSQLLHQLLQQKPSPGSSMLVRPETH
jgi:hypothetical protein